jgi:hypothetical protein
MDFLIIAQTVICPGMASRERSILLPESVNHRLIWVIIP